jgi:hypothetical protein
MAGLFNGQQAGLPLMAGDAPGIACGALLIRAGSGHNGRRRWFDFVRRMGRAPEQKNAQRCTSKRSRQFSLDLHGATFLFSLNTDLVRPGNVAEREAMTCTRLPFVCRGGLPVNARFLCGDASLLENLHLNRSLILTSRQMSK